MKDVITIGSASRDIFFLTSRGKIIPDDSIFEGQLLAFPVGAKVSIEQAHFTDGGGACNAATSLARLGLKVAPYLNVGRDEMGEQIIVELADEGADTHLVTIDESLRTGTSVILLPEGVGDRTVLFYSGANRNLKIEDWTKLKNTSWLYVSPISRQAPELLSGLVDFAKENSIKVANNPGLGQLEQGFEYMAPILEKLDILIINHSEAFHLLRTRDPGFAHDDNRTLVTELLKTGPRIVVLTCGGEGSCASDGGAIHFQEALCAEVVDPTGAGDSFGSTFVAAIIMGHDIRTAMHMAAINAASVVGSIGAQDGLLGYDELMRRMRESAL
ncbi:MAG: carbohydrate kinase family protein [Candidatus Aquicultor sp.]|nr:carbohydrate kinase family protein [Candidatus Aquicultor sp.]